jgi:RNA polymerase sigma factor (TIGR02999 family)
VFFSVSDVTRILSQLEQGDSDAAEKLLPLVYEELRKLAAVKLSHEKPGQTLQATALVHEAFLRLVGQPLDVESDPQQWNGRGHFFGAAAEAMRRILVDRARHKQTEKAGGHFQRVDLDDCLLVAEGPRVDLLALDEALEKLGQAHPRQAQLVKLKYFAGLTLHQAARALDISDATADADWAYAKSWLRVQMGDGCADGGRGSASS